MGGNELLSSVDANLQRAVQAASRFYADSGGDHTNKLDESLVELIRNVSSVDPTARLTLNHSALIELLNYMPILLTAPSTTSITRSKLLRFLFNLAQYNVSIRRHFSSDLQLCGPVFDCLKISLKEQLGPQNMIDILRLLQVLTYEKCFTLGVWTNEVISFLLKELSREEEMEWLPYSMAILCNLASRSKSLAQRIRKSSSYKEFARRLTKLLQHDSRIVVVSSLVLIGFLEEKLRELIYCPQNIAQTFQCVFNVLILGDTLMTRHIAADLLRRLVVSEAPSVSSTPSLSSTGKDLMNYSYFARCLQQTADLLVRADPRTEESTKIYDVLLSFCSVPSMRSTVCSAILDAIPTEQRLTTPILSIASTARKSIEEAIDPNVPLKALRLLNYLLKEAVEANRKLSLLIPEERLLSIIDSAVKTPIQTSDSQVVAQCERICEGLRLAEAVSGDDSLRSSLLSVLSASLCSHLLETQFLSNPVVLYMGKPTAMRSNEGLPDWSMEGVTIVLELLRVLATYKDYSKPHKVQYWNSVKDDRLPPFLAFSISRGSPSIVNHALVLYTHCAQNIEFASQNLADLVSSCTRESNQPSTSKGENGMKERERVERGRRSDSREDDRKRLNGDANSSSSSILNGERSLNQIDELIATLKNGLDLKNPKTSDLLATYENKLAMIQIREQELERLVATKDAALQQSERLRIQYAASGGRASETELARIRSLVEDCEKLKEEKDKIEEEMERKRKENEAELEKKEKELIDIRKEKKLLTREIESERELSSTLRKNIDEFKAKMEKMSKVVVQLQEQVAAGNAENERKKDEIFKINEERKGREKMIEEQKETIEKMKDEKSELNGKMGEIEKERDELKSKYDLIQEKMEERKRKMREEMMRLAGEF
ncbi:hypothetical protein PFISCL1PPCAC_5992 [Pristionchus fissidentatus]|uniref:CIP2A N-terminal domain-containing protein n=1 Tax=Pristionchus fissidentatus TaxID=1538716 RepID=A0AAV5V844_9BILA|nr:hypothetical protein PFISCL1PPCAC_5992 [Pristionchus fissidentatus]